MFIEGNGPAATPIVDETTLAVVTREAEATEIAHAQGCREIRAYKITIGNGGNPYLVPPPKTAISQLPTEVSATWAITNGSEGNDALPSEMGCVWEEVKVQALLGGEVITPTLLLYPDKVPVKRVEPGQGVDLTITVPITEAASTPPIQWVLILNGLPLFGDQEQYLRVKEAWIIP
jgi:hypothetical protein